MQAMCSIVYIERGKAWNGWHSLGRITKRRHQLAAEQNVFRVDGNLTKCKRISVCIHIDK